MHLMIGVQILEFYKNFTISFMRKKIKNKICNYKTNKIY